MSYEQEREVAIEAVVRASRLCAALQPRIHAQQESLTKADRSPVTVADLGSQALICERLLERFPDDPVVGEEDAAALRQPAQAAVLERVLAAVAARRGGAPASAEQVAGWIDHGASRQPARRYWTLDPIDGTKGFLRGEVYAVGLALIEDGEVVVAVLGCPSLPARVGEAPAGGALFHAVRGGGAFTRPLDGGADTRLRVSGREELADARLCESVESGHTSQEASARVAAALGMEAAPLRLDSMAKYAVVARGEAELYLRLPRPGYAENVWDHAAGALLVLEAGGRVTDADGEPLGWREPPKLTNARGIVVSHGRHHARALEAVRAAMG